MIIFGFARLKRGWHLVARASTPVMDLAGQAGRRGSRFQIHLKFAFCSNGGISDAKG
ncbi:hypothetical protein KIP88_19150 [Bradyrhizobium sp. SRL28]|uniref:hypothetical protein n=1 Tax=Bradyrhizobium sp. SRL28 TaxID=2836178 RepID=UPI001BDF040F|nr:hypothetical protein [Bradyrhizobium sp. SRL28]MBT1512624.1 hypothetical protein [Bradyrhizobium sp. SRL28]